MTAIALQHPKLFQFLTAIDEDLADRRRSAPIVGLFVLWRRAAQRGLSAQTARGTVGATGSADDPPQLLLPELPK